MHRPSVRAPLCALFPLLLMPLAWPAGSALAIDGATMTSGTYYESVVDGLSAEALASPEPGLPVHLVLSDSTATASYESAPDADGLAWTLRIRDLVRTHERVDALYHVIAVLPLPVTDAGRPAFKSTSRGIPVLDASGEPLVYGGEEIVLKRNVSLEKSLLPELIGNGSDLLPSLAGSGYGYTMWDTIIRYDPKYGDSIQAHMEVPYTTDADVAPPDANDERLKAYVVTWIPDLDASVPPFAVRIDVVPPPAE